MHPEQINLVLRQATCKICFESKSHDQFYAIGPCRHECCRACLQSYLNNLIMTSQVQSIRCFQEGCQHLLSEKVIESVVDQDTYKKYQKFKRNLLVAQNPNIRFCIKPDCGEVVQVQPRTYRCICKCGQEFCSRCNAPWHAGSTCEKTLEKEFCKYSKINIV